MSAPAHETDFLRWTEEQAALLRAGRLAELDVAHLLEEIEDTGREQEVALQSLLRMILVHLPELERSPAADRRATWTEEVMELRAQAESRLEDAPSLATDAAGRFGKAWPQARRIADGAFAAYDEAVELPEQGPYSLQQVLDPDFLPLPPSSRAA